MQKKDINRCQYIYKNLLEALEDRKSELATTWMFVNELMQTQRCDHYYNLKFLRDDYVDFIGEKEFQKIMNKDDYKSEELATRAVFHYNKETKKSLNQALSWKNWCLHHTYYRGERIWAILGVDSVSVTGGRMIHRFFHFLFNKFCKF
eukprot:gb/GECH01007472.1/.p1 GENE.gb/GECH01007472.1/~~gb/GECH01007472.1/.p1  ORF type:complete len:148 (+),score=7.22 gb/GECH01007472.1/:1-444(+)